MTRTLSTNLYKASKTAFPSKMSKQAKTLPVLHHVRIFTKDGSVFMQCIDTSGENWELIEESAPARVDQEFDTLVPMRPLRDWLAVTAKYKGVLELQCTKDTLTITENTDGVKTRVRFNCLSSAEFPNVPRKEAKS